MYCQHPFIEKFFKEWVDRQFYVHSTPEPERREGIREGFCCMYPESIGVEQVEGIKIKFPSIYPENRN